MMKHGITNVGCYPYMQGAGDWEDHFDTNSGQVASCLTSCISSYPHTMTKINGKVRDMQPPLAMRSEPTPRRRPV